MIFWITKENWNAEQEASPGEIIGNLREAEVVLAQVATTAAARSMLVLIDTVIG